MSAPNPTHIAIIMDGNGRWAKARGLPRVMGHREGGKAADRIIHDCLELGIKHLTLFAFSRENWQRPQSEVDALMKLLNKYLRKESVKQQQLNIALNLLGDTVALPGLVQEAIAESAALRPAQPDLTVHLAINYSGQWDIAQAAQQVANKGISITENTIAEHLSTVGIPEPDLLIRTGGEMRISNFLLWQLAYTELYFSDRLWPDFAQQDLLAGIAAYQHRERRFGLISEQITAAAQ